MAAVPGAGEAAVPGAAAGEAAVPGAAAAIPNNRGNPPLKNLAYDILANNYPVYFPVGSPEPSDQQLADAVKTEIRRACPALAARVTAGGSRRKNRKTRVRKHRKSRRH